MSAEGNKGLAKSLRKAEASLSRERLAARTKFASALCIGGVTALKTAFYVVDYWAFGGSMSMLATVAAGAIGFGATHTAMTVTQEFFAKKRKQEVRKFLTSGGSQEELKLLGE